MKRLHIVLILLLVFAGSYAHALDVVPGLKGYGTDTRAAYGAANPPEICIVDDLTDNTGSPTWDASNYSVGVYKGSLIQCLEGLNTEDGGVFDGHTVLANSGKIVLFEVSGTITENAAADDDDSFRYKLQNYSTIAGQTAPAPGVLFRNIAIYGGPVHDVLIQHVRGRMDGPPSTNYGLHKSFNFVAGSGGDTYNIVVDHISSAWGSDSQLDLYSSSTGDLYNVTVADSLFAEPRENMGLTDEEASHSKLFLIAGGGTHQPHDTLLLRNVFMNAQIRAPKLQAVQSVLVNNYCYNNRDYSIMAYGQLYPVEYSIVGNIVDGGPMSSSGASKLPSFGTTAQEWELPLSQHSVYLYDNKTDAGIQTSADDWSYVDDRTGQNLEANVKVLSAPIWPEGVTAMDHSLVENYVMDNVGAYPAYRDSLDTAWLANIANGTGISSVKSGSPAPGDWPILAENVVTLNIPADPHGDSDGDGYTNLEEMLHQMAYDAEGSSPPVDPPATVSGAAMLLVKK